MLKFYLLGLLVPLLLLRPILQSGAVRLLTGDPFTHRVPRIHHSHYGLVILALSLTFKFAVGENLVVAFFLGLGIGLMLDEFVASFYLEQKEPDITRLYVKSLWPTAAIVFGLTLFTFVLSLMFGS